MRSLSIVPYEVIHKLPVECINIICKKKDVFIYEFILKGSVCPFNISIYTLTSWIYSFALCLFPWSIYQISLRNSEPLSVFSLNACENLEALISLSIVSLYRGKNHSSYIFTTILAFIWRVSYVS